MSPDYAEHVKFADDWLPVTAGMDGALALAMGHVVFKEFYVDREVPFFTRYAKTYTDMPFLVTLREQERRPDTPDRFLTAHDLGQPVEAAEWKTVVFDAATGEPAVPNGSLGFRWSDSGVRALEPRPRATSIRRSRSWAARRSRSRSSCRASTGRRPTCCGAACPARRVGERLVTTVYDLLLAQYGVARPDLPGEWPAGYERRRASLTRPPGRSGSRASRRRSPRASPESSRATPRSPRAAP